MLTIVLMDNGSILINSETIQALITTPGNYLKVKVESTINCCPQTYTTTQTMPLSVNDYISFSSEGIEVKPALFNVVSPNKIIDGVYHFNVKVFTDENNYHFEENCAFIDVTFKCRVAEYLNKLNDINEDGQIATNVHILHYALVNGSNCGCNCIAMCDIFKQLYDLIKVITPQLQSCGC